MHRKPKMRIVKKTIIKKKTSISQNSRKFKVSIYLLLIK